MYNLRGKVRIPIWPLTLNCPISLVYLDSGITFPRAKCKSLKADKDYKIINAMDKRERTGVSPDIFLLSSDIMPLQLPQYYMIYDVMECSTF
jgi:hypothetical protein